MPTYQYRCLDCGHRFERTERMEKHGAHTPPCPECKGTKVEEVLARFFAKTARKS